jgi:multicomponent Na+:H+ antiporter subunit A
VNTTLALLVAALAAAPLTALAGAVRAQWASRVATATTLVAFAAALWNWHRPAEPIDRAWSSTWGLRLHLAGDGLASLYALLATGIGLAVVIYASRYIPEHLHHVHRPDKDITRFYGFLLLFMGSMVGLVLAQDLLLIFLFWDLTAIASYFLIGYDNQRREARISALMALLVTGVTAIGFLIGALMMEATYGTFQLPDLIAQAEQSTRVTVASGVMMIAALAKSAQVPFHFWLPRAMAAPTPVSAYLHSAAMVAAGVFLIGRLYPLIALSPTLLDILTAIGIASILTGGILALTRDNLKQLLAYSTISQYGYVVFMFGIGGTYGVAAASFYVIAHGLAKSALFLTAGAVSESTGVYELSKLGGLWRRLPSLAIASGAAAAGLAALPLTIGWFKDELFFKAAHGENRWLEAMAVLAAGLTFAYMGRFWLGIFAGRETAEHAHRIHPLLLAPIAALGAAVIVGGIWSEPFVRLGEAAASVSYGAPVEIHVAYMWGTETIMALIAFSIGTGIIVTTSLWSGAAAQVAALGARIGPEHLYLSGLFRLNRLSDRIHWIEVRDLRSRVATVLFPAAFLVGATLLSFDVAEIYTVGSIASDEIPLALMFLVIALAAITAAVPRDHFSMALALAGVGFGLAVVYTQLNAPDVALVAVLIETLFSLLIFGFLALLPRGIDHAEVVPSDDPERLKPIHNLRDILLAGVAGVFAFVVAWGVLSRPAPLESIVASHIERTPEAHGGDVVTVILADFRGLDTAGEITVVGIAFLGFATLLRRRVPR